MKFNFTCNELQIGDSILVFGAIGNPIIHWDGGTLRVREGIDRSRVIAFCQRHQLTVDRINETAVSRTYFDNLFLFSK
jgi:hypothetical protein